MLRADLSHLDTACRRRQHLEGEAPWDRLYRWSEENLSIEGQEQLVSLMLEPYGELVDELADDIWAPTRTTPFASTAAMPLQELRTIVDDVYGWALDDRLDLVRRA